MSDLMQIPKGGANPYADHPGFDAQDCPLSIVVTRRGPYGGVQGGFACSMTGGHCLPCDQCESRRQRASEIEAREAEFFAAGQP